MKKQKTEVKKLRIGKETLLPLGSRQMNEVAGGVRTRVIHLQNSHFYHP
jgi:hypothetical protein